MGIEQYMAQGCVYFHPIELHHDRSAGQESYTHEKKNVEVASRRDIVFSPSWVARRLNVESLHMYKVLRFEIRLQSAKCQHGRISSV